MGKNRDIVVIGGSMGAIEGLRSLLSQLPPDLPAALFAVIHTSAASPGNLARVLEKKSALPVRTPASGERYETGTLYIAPPDHHLLISGGRLVLTRGPRENRTRPAIDPLFRSAAVCCTSRVTGVILSGYLDDGASGLRAVMRCGGTAVVLDPETTLFSDMPRHALRVAETAHSAPIGKMGELLADLVRQPASEPPSVPEDLRIEVERTEKAMGEYGQGKEPGRSTFLSCPDCGGPLWQMEDEKLNRFRCTIGHAFTEENLLDSQSEAAEQALWVALRTLEERVRFLRNLAEKGRTRGQAFRRWEEQAAETQRHAQSIRALLTGNSSVPGTTEPEPM